MFDQNLKNVIIQPYKKSHTPGDMNELGFIDKLINQ